MRYYDIPCFGPDEQKLKFTYPFRFVISIKGFFLFAKMVYLCSIMLGCFRLIYMTVTSSCFQLVGDFAAQSQFFVATGVLTFLFCIAIAVIYILFDSFYQNNALVPLAVSI